MIVCTHVVRTPPPHSTARDSRIGPALRSVARDFRCTRTSSLHCAFEPGEGKGQPARACRASGQGWTEQRARLGARQRPCGQGSRPGRSAGTAHAEKRAMQSSGEAAGPCPEAARGAALSRKAKVYRDIVPQLTAQRSVERADAVRCCLTVALVVNVGRTPLIGDAAGAGSGRLALWTLVVAVPPRAPERRSWPWVVSRGLWLRPR
jgi:hypothetical protein